MEHVGAVFAGINRALQVIEDLLPLDDQDRVWLMKQLLDSAAVDVVALVLKPIDLWEVVAQLGAGAAHTRQTVDGVLHLGAAQFDTLRQLEGLWPQFFDGASTKSAVAASMRSRI